MMTILKVIGLFLYAILFESNEFDQQRIAAALQIQYATGSVL